MMKFSPAKFYEHYKRSIVKTATYRVAIIISSYTIIYLITGQHEVTTVLVIISNLMSTLIYFFHERVWNHIHWGKGGRK